MKLQVAIDLLSTADALTLLNKVADSVDIIELGTPLIKQQGLSVVTNVKAAYPDKLVFADMKTMDAGELEANLAFAAGADIVTVLASAADSTIAGAVKSGKAHGKAVVADMIGVADKATRLKELKELGVSWVELHAGLDEQAQAGYSIDNLLAAGRDASIPFSVAGGINLDRIGAVEKAGATIAVAGAAIYGAADPAAAAKALRAKIEKLG
ncbi:3-hexulose-6-phosphate synthase [Terriglobus tenax]|uniref:3-hexulose-6-phosphate synthase n=1 Tax=Terriglobus tenax TaxID=1111115 RepID=UPI0021E00490|nr:3-hexulose-6-phosphate synthase [Terriglobus tenax]